MGKKDPTTIRSSGNSWNCQKRGALPWRSQPGHSCSSSDSVQPQGRVTVWNPPVPQCSQVCANDETEKAEKKTEKKTRKIFALQLNSGSNKPPTPPPNKDTNCLGVKQAGPGRRFPLSRWPWAPLFLAVGVGSERTQNMGCGGSLWKAGQVLSTG